MDDADIRNGLDEILLEYLERESYAEAMLKTYDDVNEAYKVIENYDALKRSNVATAMTLDYRIWRITEVDRMQAEIDYEAAQESMSPDEFPNMYNNGQISLSHFDKSAHYRARMKEFIQRRGKDNRRERNVLEDELDHLIERVQHTWRNWYPLHNCEQLWRLSTQGFPVIRTNGHLLRRGRPDLDSQSLRATDDIHEV